MNHRFRSKRGNEVRELVEWTSCPFGEDAHESPDDCPACELLAVLHDVAPINEGGSQ